MAYGPRFSIGDPVVPSAFAYGSKAELNITQPGPWGSPSP